MTKSTSPTSCIPLDERDPSSVRAVILARASDTSAKMKDMESQVTNCVTFIGKMGWKLAFEPYTFTEAAITGMRDVRRPVLDDVLKLAITGQIDVIVCAEFDRVARTKMRRYQAIQTALDYGVEFRFANIAPDGRLPDDPASRMYRAFLEEYGQMEAEKITERMGGPKRRRFEDGLPHGGRGKQLYGYGPGERRMRDDKQMGLLTWVIREDTAKVVRWLYDQADTRDPVNLSLRGLATELVRQGVKSPTGLPHWTVTQIRNILRNPKYCGLGRNLRYETTHVRQRDDKDQRVYVFKKRIDRMKDRERWDNETYPISTDVIPPIICQEQWERVQAKLDEAAKLNRYVPRRTDPNAAPSLLSGGFCRCETCGGIMGRYWVHGDLYYRCRTSAGTVGTGHRVTAISAPQTDELVLVLLAKALTDPKQVLALADAAEKQAQEATTDAALARSALAAYEKHMEELAAQEQELRTALAALGRIAGVDQQIAGIRERLAQLHGEREQAKADRDDISPYHDHAEERARFLRSIFEQVESGELGFDGKVFTARFNVSQELNLGPTMIVYQAADLLGVSYEDFDRLGLPTTVIRTREGFDEYGQPIEQVAKCVSTETVLAVLLKRAPHEAVRKLMRDLNAKIVVSPGRTREEILAGTGHIPLAERAALQLLGSVSVSTDAANVTMFSQVTNAMGVILSARPA